MKEQINIKVGDIASITKKFTKNDVISFSNISLDKNPVHLDEDYAAETIFKRPIVHGLLPASLISAVIGTKLPGIGSIYLSQELKFELPVYINDTITASVEVLSIRTDKPIFTLHTICKNQKGNTVTSGNAVVILKK